MKFSAPFLAVFGLFFGLSAVGCATSSVDEAVVGGAAAATEGSAENTTVPASCYASFGDDTTGIGGCASDARCAVDMENPQCSDPSEEIVVCKGTCTKVTPPVAPIPPANWCHGECFWGIPICTGPHQWTCPSGSEF